jgi:hypothetical protein
VPLNKSGRRILKRLRRNHSGRGSRLRDRRYQYLLCPFHQERTASWCIDLKTGLHYCFGCHQRGDIWNLARNQPAALGQPKLRVMKVLPLPMVGGLPHDDDIPF